MARKREEKKQSELYGTDVKTVRKILKNWLSMKRALMGKMDNI